MARKVQVAIREEIENEKFCLIVDESRDESKKEQMAIVVRFVDTEGFIRERFLDLIHVKDTTSLTLKNAIASALSDNGLSDNGLSICRIRGQGYDGASNMRSVWNGLQALILKECPYAYYVHCMAHQLQLTLVATSTEVHEVHNFFQNVNFVINVVSASIKHEIEISDMNKGFVDLIRSRSKKNNTTVEHHYRVDVFNVTIYQQLQEINGRFSEQSTELLIISAGLDPRQVKLFSIENACKLAEKFYPADFTSQEKALLECQLRHYEIDMRNNPVLKDSSSLADLCNRLVESGKSAV